MLQRDELKTDISSADLHFSAHVRVIFGFNAVHYKILLLMLFYFHLPHGSDTGEFSEGKSERHISYLKQGGL